MSMRQTDRRETECRKPGKNKHERVRAASACRVTGLAVMAVAGAALLLGMIPRLSGGSAASAAPAEAATLPLDRQTMTYEVYAGGVNAVTAVFRTEYLSSGRYYMMLEAKTRGFLEKIVPWSGTFETEGWRLADGAERPELHQSTAVWRGENDHKQYGYGKDGSFKFLKATEAGKDVTPKELDDELTQGTTDALTAALQAMQNVAETGICDSRAEIFDGSRRYELMFTQEQEEVLEPTRYNIFRGVARRCAAEVKPMAGKWHDKPRGWMSIQEQGRDKGSLPTVWLAQMEEGAPAIPVKIRVKTDYGTLFMHLTGYQRSGAQSAAAE